MWRCACTVCIHLLQRSQCMMASIAAVDLLQNNWAKYTGGAIHISYCNGVQASFPSNTFIGEARPPCVQLPHNPQRHCRCSTAAAVDLPWAPLHRLLLTAAASCCRQQRDQVQRSDRVQSDDLPQEPARVPRLHARRRRLPGAAAHRQHLRWQRHHPVFAGTIFRFRPVPTESEKPARCIYRHVCGQCVSVWLSTRSCGRRCMMTVRCPPMLSCDMVVPPVLQAWFFP